MSSSGIGTPSPTSDRTAQVEGTRLPDGIGVDGSPSPPASGGLRSRRGLIWAGLALGAIGLTGFFLYPRAVTALNTITTDDAYVNGHATFVAPRVTGQVAKVLVDDNNRVRKGQLLVRLDKEPYEVQVNLRNALLEVAQADLREAEAKVRALEANARGRRWALQTAIERVNDQVAALRAKVATMESRRATVERARNDFTRSQRLVQRGAATVEELDLRRESIRVAEALMNEALAEVSELRVALGLPASPPPGEPLDSVPADLPQTFSAVRVALADVAEILAQLGLPLPQSEATPQQVLDDFRKRDASGDVNVIFTNLIRNAPTVKQAEAGVVQARRQLEEAELNLSYCDVTSEIDGVVTRRNVNPGNNVQPGQALMAIRSVEDIWIDANFKETQLADLVIGQRVDIYADMYGGRRVFPGRISGFMMGTGSTLALLPPQNATGNFVKVVQRLPVRIDLVERNPEDAPLFVGLSVVPYVHFREPPSGPDAGRRLQQPLSGGAAAGPSTAPRRGPEG